MSESFRIMEYQNLISARFTVDMNSEKYVINTSTFQRIVKFVFLPIVLFCGSCSPSVFTPIYVQAPATKPVANVDLIQTRPTPEEVITQLSFVLFETEYPTEDDYHNSPGAIIKEDGAAPTVIIVVPEKAKEGIYNSLVGETAGDAVINDFFAVDGYFVEAEQSIGKSLLRKGFDVLDRSKFEAKLRDLRDQQFAESGGLTDSEYGKIRKEIDQQFEIGKISDEEYIQKIQRLTEDSKLKAAEREEDGGIDIAELYRVAQSETGEFDYLFQINRVEVTDASSRLYSIRPIPEVKQFVKDNKDLMFGEMPSSLPSRIKSNWVLVEFEAKLIEVSSGSIAWIGSYQLESWGVENIFVHFDVKKVSNNADEINRAIVNYNSELEAAHMDALTSKETLDKLYKQASKEKEFKKDEQVFDYKKRLTASVFEAEDVHEKNIEKLREVMNRIPDEADDELKYSYTIRGPYIEPNLVLDHTQSDLGREELIEHKMNLLKTATSQMIETIQVEQVENLK